MSENNDRKEESDAGEQTGSSDSDPKNFGDDSQKVSAPEVDTDSAEYPSAPGADESPQEPITEESSPSAGPEKKPDGPDADESGKTTGSPSNDKEAASTDAAAEGNSAEDYPSTPGEGTNEDDSEQDGGDQNEDSA